MRDRLRSPDETRAAPEREATSDASWRRPGSALLVSTYELGHQPHGITLPKAFLERAGFAPATMDLAVEEFDPAKVRKARFVAISVPMHTALRVGEGVARRIRQIQPRAHICFHGHYAALHEETLRPALADSVLGGELEARMVELVEGLEASASNERADHGNAAARTVIDEENGVDSTVLQRLDFPVPSRRGLPDLDRYAHLVHSDTHAVTGYTEATRGCLHLCGHCPIPAVYAGRLFVVPDEVVLQDVRQQVLAGARHITFGDADFLNGPAHALRIASALHDGFPEVTFDFTAKVEHIVRYPEVVRELAERGAIFMVSAVECLNDRILSILDKGHTRSDVDEALSVARQSGVALRPSLLPFTPWATRQDFIDILDWVEREELIDHVDPVQFTIRLLVPPGSLLLAHPQMQAYIGEMDREHLTYLWRHPNPGMDELQRGLVSLVEESNARGEEASQTFRRIRAHEMLAVAGAVSGRTTSKAPRRRHQKPPRLTESWFC